MQRQTVIFLLQRRRIGQQWPDCHAGAADIGLFRMSMTNFRLDNRRAQKTGKKIPAGSGDANHGPSSNRCLQWQQVRHVARLCPVGLVFLEATDAAG
jgi:hypothetical protein